MLCHRLYFIFADAGEETGILSREHNMDYRKYPKRISVVLHQTHPSMSCISQMSSQLLIKNFCKDFRNAGRDFRSHLEWEKVPLKMAKYLAIMIYAKVRTAALSVHSKICIATEIFGAKRMREQRRQCGLLHSPHAAAVNQRGPYPYLGPGLSQITRQSTFASFPHRTSMQKG